MKQLLLLLLIPAMYACAPSPVSLAQIDAEETAGNFTRAAYLIDLYIAEQRPPEATVYDLQWRKEKMRRIALEFDQTKNNVRDYIKTYYPDVTDEMLSKWEAEKSLEALTIDGERKYFSEAAPNLFRIDREAAARKREINPPAPDKKEETLKQHLPEVIASAMKTKKPLSAPVRMKVSYQVTLKPNAVPAGETVRCWLPYLREDIRRQTNVRLLAVNDSNYVISPPEYAHRTLYMEKTARQDEPLTFAYEFSYQSAAEWFGLETKTLMPYDTESEVYKTCTAERPPHIVFSDSIKAISKRIVGNETNPYRKMKKIFTWIDETFPWAGATDYSTIDNIPAYVLENRHGDCGQVTLLFMTLARYNGIPARWQSGFMMHPHRTNLHDWSEFYLEGVGWIPMDESFGVNRFSEDEHVKYFYTNGLDAYRWIVNSDYSQPLFPTKIYPRSDLIDFQRGELEWIGGNLFYDQWSWDFDVSYDEN
ncbi:MAG: transglutaminase domain-containing protein [Prevotellaceae bacterium]|jgi:transglutaminase-like putative cysteine protease|nr:transglutaminase domain-containing protein [Prevotellaceae bacterium]